MSQNTSKLRGHAILVISGRCAESIRERATSRLAEFVVELSQSEEILIAGRVILAIEFHFDPAHLSAIHSDLDNFASELDLELAVEVL